MKPTLQLQINHQLTMTPQLQQAIRLLQLSTIDLQAEIQTALDSNIMLELSDVPTQEDVIEETLDAKEKIAELDTSDQDYSGSLENHWNDAVTPRRAYEPQGNEIEILNSPENTLQDHLMWQMQLTPFSDLDRLIAMIIIDAVNEDGLLACTLDDIISTVKSAIEVDPLEIEAVLHRIQQFDPVGVAARNLEECLLIQLAHFQAKSPWFAQTKELLRQHLPLLAKRDYATLKRRLRVNQKELEEIIHCIQQLNPRPGTQIGQQSSSYLIPDVYTFLKDQEWQVELNPLCTPPLRVNDGYAALIRRQDTSRDNQFLRDQLQEARWFLKSITNRNDTLLKVARCIVAQQQAFLLYGDEAMRPLTLQQIAEIVNMHESTISRVTTQKYIHTPRGIFELKYFFSSHINTDTGIDCSGTAIRALIKKYVAAENRKKPLSDDKLSKLLNEQGIKIARRTVGKYRETLTIPPSNERKQPF